MIEKSIEEEHTIQWPTEKGFKGTKYVLQNTTQKTKDGAT